MLYGYMNHEPLQAPKPQRNPMTRYEEPRLRTAAETLYPNLAEKQPEPRREAGPPLWASRGQKGLIGSSGEDRLEGQFTGPTRGFTPAPSQPVGVQPEVPQEKPRDNVSEAFLHEIWEKEHPQWTEAKASRVEHKGRWASTS